MGATHNPWVWVSVVGIALQEDDRASSAGVLVDFELLGDDTSATHVHIERT